MYQIADLPDDVLDKKKRIDSCWVLISEITNDVGEAVYKELADVMLTVLSIPHSNVDSESVFSTVRKVKTEAKGEMKTKTLSAMVVHKKRMLALGIDPHNFHPSPELLAKCKSATYHKLHPDAAPK